ncbi:hypothetical protein AB6A40_003762 [Gnathostoma spinigerum]|uniref:Persulfide dioxygenase ETHE1, mitochondrial n=1 Tax=Gnathostoma spinigerum TaxID=75299 RepID=A0ABD6EJA3_9BILA
MFTARSNLFLYDYQNTTMSTLLFRQLFEPISCTYTYVLACVSSGKGIIIDPVIEEVARDAKLIKQLQIDPIYGANTHVHADHVTGTGQLKHEFPSIKSVLSAHADAKADMFVKDGEILKFGKEELEVRTTPGHTNGCITFVSHKHGLVFTGDALLIRGCGRTDFQQGNSRTLYESIHKKIFTLPPHFSIFPGHDYMGFTQSSVDEEKKFNPRLTENIDEFVKIMENLNLKMPKLLETSLLANKLDGRCELMDENLRNRVMNRI